MGQNSILQCRNTEGEIAKVLSLCLETMPSSTLRFDLALLIVVSPFGVLCRHLTYRTGVGRQRKACWRAQCAHWRGGKG